MYRDLMHSLSLSGLWATMYYTLMPRVSLLCIIPIHARAIAQLIYLSRVDRTEVRMYCHTRECNIIFDPIVCSSGGGCKVAKQLSHLT
jgi:hypothetical protein